MRKVIEGWLYRYEDVECLSVVITDKKIELQDAIKDWEEYWKMSGGKDFMSKEIIENIKKEIPKGVVSFYSLRPEFKHANLADLLDEFKGKKVRIAIEVLEEGDRSV